MNLFSMSLSATISQINPPTSNTTSQSTLSATGLPRPKQLRPNPATRESVSTRKRSAPVESSSESEEEEDEAEEDSEEEEEEEDSSSARDLVDIEATVKPRKSKLTQPREYFRAWQI